MEGENLTTYSPASPATVQQQNCRLLLVSHSYLEPENRKTALALREYVDVRVLTPRRLPVPRKLRGHFFKVLDIDAYPEAQELFIVRRAVYRPVWPSMAQFGLVSFSLGMRRFRPDVIHVELPPWSLMFWQVVLARRLFAPTARITVLAKKNTYRRYRAPVGWLKDGLARAGLRQVDLVLAASKMSARMFEREFGVVRDRVVMIRQIGVDGVKFSPRKRDHRRDASLVVGYSGRLEPEKGIRHLVEAVECCRATTGVNVRLQLLGAGTLDEELKLTAAERPWLELHDPVPSYRVSDFLHSLDIFVLPTDKLPDHEEHDAQSLVEALTAGVAAIGTRSGIIPDLLEDGTGLIVPPGDTEALAEALETLVVDETARERYARRGRLKAEAEFTLEAVARSYAQICDRLCQ
jgi:glycosyltransferase involved in cell wall biosynthesis